MRAAHHAAMRSIVLIAALLLFCGNAHAASPEENYFAARDGHIEALAAARKRGAPDKEIAAREKRALADLERQVRRLVGNVALKDAKGAGRINLEGLQQGDMEFGMLDGLVFEAKDGKSRTVVTTQNLLKNWLREHQNWWRTNNVPQGVAPALRFAPFYTQALGGGAAFGSFGELSVGTPDGGFATALLIARAQDIGSRNPDELVVSVARGHRVFIVTAKAAAKIAPVAECEAMWPALKEKTDAAFEAYRASGMKDQGILDRSNKLSDDTDAAYMRCFAERAPKDANWKTLTAQAQAIADALPMK